MAIPLTDRGLKIAASRMGISTDEYVHHFEAGERWCAWHAQWEAVAAFRADSRRAAGVMGWCKEACSAADRKRYLAQRQQRRGSGR